jgi:N-acetylneuraminic acid mutarotase
MASPRTSHAAARLPDGRVLVAGGRAVPAHGSSALASVERFDPATLTWIGGSPMRGPREGHSATEIGGSVAVVGGWGIDDGIARASQTTELYDPAHDEWRELGALWGGALGHTTTALSGGSLLVVSGSGAFQKTWHSGWYPAGTMREPRSGHVAAGLDDGRVLVAGGTWYRVLHTPEIYDPSTSTWTTTVDHPFGIGAGTATRLLDGRVLVVSGRALFYERAPATGAGGGAAPGSE